MLTPTKNSMAEGGVERYVSDELLDARYFSALNRFDIRFSRTMWVYDNVPAGCNVLHLACGAGLLALLKRKGINLTGVDVLEECALAARRNGYEATTCSELTQLPFADASFDYVASLEGLGKISDEQRQVLIAEIKRVLKPGGMTLCCLECNDLSEEQKYLSQFRSVFQNVDSYQRYALCLSTEDLLDQADKNNQKFEVDFVEYLRGLSFRERRAFDIAMGYVFGKVSDLGIQLPASGICILLKASDEPLGSFYNQHRDRRALFSISQSDTEPPLCLDRDPEVSFDDGWYEPQMLPPVARWMGARGRVRFHVPELMAISLDVMTTIPELRTKPVELDLFINGVRLCAFSLVNYGWLELQVGVPEALNSDAHGEFELELRANRTSEVQQSGGNDCPVSVAICNIEVHQQVSGL